MDIQKPYSREISPNYSYPVTENFEYSSITSAFESLLSIDQLNRAVLSTEPQSIKLTFKVKKLASAMKSSQDAFTSFFSYIPQALKQDLTPTQVISAFIQDFTSEISDFPIALCSIHVSKLLSHTGRPQEIFEKEVPDGKAKIIVFELNWDTDATMENVSKVFKCIPGNIQSQGFMEIASLISCTSNYYSTICKNQENWKSTDKFADKEPLPWVKVAWMMISGLKYPNTIVYQRVEGYKSTANFITSLDFENLVKFSKKQDERAKIIARNTDGINAVENKNFGVNKFVRPNSETKEMYSRLEANYNYSKGENTYNYGIEPRVAGQGTEKYVEDTGRKAQTPNMRKYDYLENKPLPTDEKLQALNEKYSFKPCSRFDLPKPPYRKEEVGLEKANSPKNKEDSYRGWNKNDEMERIHLGSPKDKEYPQFRAFSRQEESYPKLSFTPQRNMSRDIEKFTHISPKESEEPSPYFREKLNFQDKYSDLIKDNRPVDGVEDRKPWGEGQKFREDPENNYKSRLDNRFDYKAQEIDIKDDRGEGIKREDLIEYKPRDLYKDPLAGYKSYSDLNKNEPIRSELPPRGAYRSNIEAITRDEQVKKPLSAYEELNEKYKFLDNKDSKLREGNYLSEQYKTEDPKPRVLYEEPQDDDYKFKDPYYEKKDRFSRDYQAPEVNEGYKAKVGFDYKTIEEIKKKDQPLEGFDRNRVQNYKLSEKDYRTDFKARELPQDIRENYRQDIEINPQGTNFREYDRDPYEKYKAYTAKNDYENQFKKPYNEFSLQNPDSKYEDYSVKAREIYKPSELPPSVVPLEPSRQQDSSNLTDWSCAKCSKKVQGSSYECNDCRLINWDQFYKVKSQLHCKTKTEDNVYRSQAIAETPPKEDQGRRMYSFSDNKEEENADWVCTSCNMNNKSLFFLCKSCRKPRLQSSDVGNEGRKEYKFTS
ncbi:hypothetical protein SteCoe_15223 [Stentor coeruleus]|uniref:RanBP2-type domain-containing protein n=1 Tax=Stentor coeruleus TaxID=5963 RepID=A0A1R2C462_9CILI|nr:hypothetical protein SteCoe_15223 [Stentor coeruleus]